MEQWNIIYCNLRATRVSACSIDLFQKQFLWNNMEHFHRNPLAERRNRAGKLSRGLQLLMLRLLTHSDGGFGC